MIEFAAMIFQYGAWLSRGHSREELLETMAQAGAQGGEAFCNGFMNGEEDVARWREALAATGLKMPVMDLIVDLAEPDKTLRRAAFESMRKGLDVCEAFGSEIVHVAGAKSHAGVAPSEGRRLFAEGLLAFADDAEKRGMTLAFEDFDPAPELICSAADCLELLRLTEGRVKFVFDTGNFEAVGERAEASFDALLPNIRHFHFKDFQRDAASGRLRGSRLGQGVVANREIARKIKESGYSGWIALESYPQNGAGPKETAVPEMALLKSWLQDVRATS